MKRHSTILAALFVLSACATITTGTSQPLTVVTPYADNASCQLRDTAGGSWYIKETPNTVTVTKGDGPMTITCEKAGYNNGVTVLNEKFQGATLGNIILGGGVGVIVDAASGAAQEYPKDVKVYLEPKKWESETRRSQWMEEKRQYDLELAAKFDSSSKQSPDYPSQRRR
jgi:hypothetical protein